MNAGWRGVLEAGNEIFSIAGVIVGIPIAGRLLRTDPRKVFTLVAAAASAAAVGLVGFALAPTVWMAAGCSMFTAFCISIVPPGLSTLASLLIPPRARSFGFVVTNLYVLPGLFFLAVAGSVGSDHGVRIGLLVMVPVFLAGAYILSSAGTHVANDVRSVQLAALAHAESRVAHDRGESKLLVCRGVDVSYGQVQVLFGVELDVADGEILALLGTNGAGKSTLLKAICGLVDPSGGAIVFDGTDVTYSSPQHLLRNGVVYMPGGRSVFPTLTVAENLKAATWQRRADEAPIAAEIASLLERFPRLAERYEQPAGNLSGGEQQMLGLSMAFLAEPRLLMIDELSLGLAPAVVADLLSMVRDIHDRGTTVILVEQSVNLALTLADRAVFMEKGEVRFEGSTADLLGREDVLRSVFLEGASSALGARQGTRNGAAKPRRATAAVAPAEPNAPVVLEIAGMTKSFGGIRAVSDVSLTVAPGEVVGIIGPNGAGKTTLFDLISGFISADAGRVLIRGTDATAWGPERRARAGLGRSFQDARLFPSMTVREALSMGFDRHLLHRDLVSGVVRLPDQVVEEHLLDDRVEDLIELLGLGAFADKFVSELSTGSRRIVDIGASIAHDPAVLLLDEPSSGIAQREAEALGPLLERIQTLTGTALVVIEHDMPLVTSIAQRLIALDLGAVVTTGTPDEVIAHPAVVASYLGSDQAAIQRSGTV